MSKTIFITGATGGIGGEIANIFASNGYRVAVGYHSNSEKAENLTKSLAGEGHIAVQCTVNDTVSVKQAIANIKDAFGGLDVLVNNGGSTKFVAHNDLDGLTDDIIDDIFSMHVRGVFACVRTAVPIMNQGGCVVNITSIAAESGMGSNIAYCAAKGALNTMIKSLARVLAPNIRVIGVAPGLLNTEFVSGAGADAFFEAQAKLTPMQRLATTKEVATAVYSGVEHMTFTTGRVLNVDGGRLLS